MKNLKIIFKIFLVVLLISNTTFVSKAIECIPSWNWNRTVEQNCSFPSWWKKIYWNINVWNKTITIPNWVVMWINLSSNKITFSGGKILLQWNAKIDNSVSNRHYITKSYSIRYWGVSSSSASNAIDCNHWACTSCPAWTKAMNSSRNWVQSSSPRSVWNAGTMYCAKF